MAAAGRFLLPFPLLLLVVLPVAAATGARPGPDRLNPLELCQLPKVVGRCRASILRWWFNGTAGACQSFVFGGCEGNSNNFPTELECRESCGAGAGALKKPDYRSKQPASDSTYAESCTTPFVTGPCRAAFPRWYHNATTRTCQQFTYGGCRGNKNNYLNEEECLNRCFIQAAHPGEDFHGDFFPTKALVFGGLLVILAVIFIAYVTYLTIKTCWRKPEIPGLGLGWSPGDDKEYLMSNAYTL